MSFLTIFCITIIFYAKIHCDFQDLIKIQECFNEHEPFNLNEGKLQSLSSRLTATNGNGINPDQAEEIGTKIQMQLDGVGHQLKEVTKLSLCPIFSQEYK